MTQDARKVIDSALPARSDAYGALLQCANEANDSAGEDVAWDRLYGLQQTVRPEPVLGYVESLIKARRIARAQEVWRQLLDRDQDLRPYAASPGKLVVNGGFENALLNGGFDWRTSADTAVRVEMDTLNFHEGRQSLLMVVEPPSRTEIGLAQYVPVEPRTRYRLRSFVRSQELETASGPRFAARDALDGHTLGWSSEIVGTTPWNEWSFEFTTGPETSLIQITLLRDAPEKLIRGKLWIDDVTISKAGE
jgi:hypothetical protein